MMKIGTNISSEQENLLRRAKSNDPRLVAHAIERIINDDDIREGKEDIHPDWVELFNSKRELIQRFVPEGDFEEFQQFFSFILPYDSQMSEIYPEKLRTTFLLGAGSSKPIPSGIPTVKELLPQLLERARRLDREDVSMLADFCDKSKIDNIEDLLTAAQLANFCSRNPIVLGLLNYLLYRQDRDQEEKDFSARELSRGRIFRRAVESSADVSSVAFLQDTLQVLFGLLASTMLPAESNTAHTSIASYCKKPLRRL